MHCSLSGPYNCFQLPHLRYYLYWKEVTADMIQGTSWELLWWGTCLLELGLNDVKTDVNKWCTCTMHTNTLVSWQLFSNYKVFLQWNKHTLHHQKILKLLVTYLLVRPILIVFTFQFIFSEKAFNLKIGCIAWCGPAWCRQENTCYCKRWQLA